MTVVVASQEIELLDRIGGGHFGEVHKGKVRPYGDVAVKVITPPPRGAFLSWADHVLGEADHLHQAEHENVVRFLACSYDAAANRVFIVMERCRGSVADEVGDQALPLRTAATYIRDVLVGLECLHQRGMVHRDIKPGNLLVHHSGRAKVGDFGLVSDNLVQGYASYQGYYYHLAPEVFSSRTTSPKTDVWAMGMTVYRLINGEKSFARFLEKEGVAAGDVAEIKASILRGGLANRLVWLPHVPKEWRSFVRAALRDDPSARYQNATQMMSGFAELPVVEPWESEETDSALRWRKDGARRTVVEWRRARAKHAVQKWTEPLPGAASGQKRTSDSQTFTRAPEAERYCERLLGTRTA